MSFWPSEIVMEIGLIGSRIYNFKEIKSSQGKTLINQPFSFLLQEVANFGGYRITPKHCRATKTLPSSDPRANGPTICMFNHECAQRGGEVVGACMDGFLFGACCQIPPTHELASTLINEAQNAYFQQHQQQQKLHQAAVVQSSFESSYGQAQQSVSEEYQDQQNLDKVYQQLSSTSSISPPSNAYGGEEPQQQQEEAQPAYSSSSSSTEATHSQLSSASVEFEQEAAQPAEASDEKKVQPLSLSSLQTSMSTSTP